MRVYVWFVVDEKALKPFHGRVIGHVQGRENAYAVAYDNGEFEAVRHLYPDDENLKKEGGWTIDTLNEPLKPLFWWMGGKSKELHEIMRYLPAAYTVYVEPFAGSCALMMALLPERPVVNDMDARVARLYEDIGAGHGPRLHEQLTSRAPTATAKLLPSTQFLHERLHSFRGLPGTKTKKKSGACLERMEIVRRLLDPRYEQLLKRASIHNMDFGFVMQMYDQPDAFVFLDPPYMDTMGYDDGAPFTVADHQRLSNLFRRASAKCLLVVQRHDLMVRLYGDFIKGEYETSYGAGEGRLVTHLVIANYDI